MRRKIPQCWNCGSLELVDEGSYQSCGRCGATIVDLPKLGAPEFVEEPSRRKTELGPQELQRRRPSGHATRRSAKAREGKE